jgi:AcrR family transcriptional regulator
MGLRELKKQRTRQLIAETAWGLFAERGFDRVTVAEVAREAQVAEATVFNYFRTKEDLFYWRLEAYGSRLVDAIGSRDAGEPVLVAFRRFLLDSGGLLLKVEEGDHEALEQLRTVNRLIAASPALQARERQALARNTDALAELLAAETGGAGGDVRPQVVANALMGVQRALIDYVRRRILGDHQLDLLASDVRGLAEDALALLERGLADYAGARAGESAGAGAAGR